MSFPATYNIRYYAGDLFEFIIRPKTSSGDPFPISTSTYVAKFFIAPSRGGTSSATIEASAVINGNNVLCSITPFAGNQLSAGTTYFYDVSVQSLSDTNTVYTLLTGTISVTKDITPAGGT